MLRNRWTTGPDVAPDPLAQALHAARLIGAEPELVLHGGGNTSVKIERDGAWALHVKGSGADLARVAAHDYTALALAPVRDLLRQDGLDNRAMYAALKPYQLLSDAPRPSIETLMHAGLPATHVIHTHAAAILAITNTRQGARHLHAAFGASAPIVAYHHSGVALARACVSAWEQAERTLACGLILAHHGALTWGDSALAAYERMLDLSNRADSYLNDHGAALPADSGTAPTASAPETLLAIARIRADASRVAGRPLIATVRAAGAIAAFARRSDVTAITRHGPSTPGHAIFTKRVPLVGLDVAAFAADYRRYLGGSMAVDCAPRVVLDPMFGMLALGVNKRYADISADVFAHDAAIIARASALDRYATIGADAMRQAELEYSGFEARVAREFPLAGRVFVIDHALERCDAIADLLHRGAAVAAIDARAQVQTMFDQPAFLGLPSDQDAQPHAASAAVVEAVIRAFGGVDTLDADAAWLPSFAPFLGIANA